jgi:hypothetical protein
VATLQQRMKSLSRKALALLLIAGSAAQASDLVIYDEALRNGFSTGYSYNDGLAVGSTDQAHIGMNSVAFTGGSGTNAFNAVAFTSSTPLSTSTYSVLHFWIYGSSPGNQNLDIEIYPDKNAGANIAASLNGYIAGGAVGNGVWREVTVDLTQPPLSFNGTFDRIDIQSESSIAQPTVYLDDIALRSAVIDPIFNDDFESAVVLPPPVNGLVDESNISVLSMLSERFTGRDSANHPRVAVLAYNDQGAGPGGTKGGELRQFKYQVGANTRTVNASGSGASGFGYVVSHPNDDSSLCVGGDSSSLGHFFAGTKQSVFVGRHHAIYRFKQNYPRYCSTAAPKQERDIPVTIDWIFSTGRDNPLWAISYDLSALPVNILEDDSRAPYGELLFDGSASEGAHSVIAGMGWGDRYQFVTTSSPVSLQSQWTWNTPNTIPYVKLWTAAIDATMGTVQTQPITQQDAGGYFGSDRWNTTSTTNACNAGDEYPGAPAHRMPCTYNWDFQSINYSLDPANPSNATNNTRLAWGTEFGFLGQSAYHINGSAYWGGPLADATASGYPRKSYSLYVVLGLHSTDAVAAQVAQVETSQTLSLSTTVGTVATSGSAGIDRPDTVTYSPAGYDPVYSAITFNASGNALDAILTIGSGTLKKPLIILRGYTANTYPTTVKFAGATLTMDVDYFPSLRTNPNELWITLNRDVSGASNRLQITP